VLSWHNLQKCAGFETPPNKKKMFEKTIILLQPQGAIVASAPRKVVIVFTTI